MHDQPRTVVVVDDDASLREVVRRLLVGLGYSVLLASTAVEAINIAAEHPEVEVVLTDITLKGTGGVVLRQWLLARYPEMPVVFMSGHDEIRIARDGIVLNPMTLFLRKPFTVQLLGATMAQAYERLA